MLSKQQKKMTIDNGADGQTKGDEGNLNIYNSTVSIATVQSSPSLLFPVPPNLSF